MRAGSPGNRRQRGAGHVPSEIDLLPRGRLVNFRRRNKRRMGSDRGIPEWMTCGPMILPCRASFRSPCRRCTPALASVAIVQIRCRAALLVEPIVARIELPVASSSQHRDLLGLHVQRRRSYSQRHRHRRRSPVRITATWRRRAVVLCGNHGKKPDRIEVAVGFLHQIDTVDPLGRRPLTASKKIICYSSPWLIA
jgi:hypothetical protein